MAALYLDNDVSWRVRDLLRRGHTVTTARDMGLSAAGDHEHLFTAAAQRWVLISYNAGHFEVLHDAWLYWSRHWNIAHPPAHSGILIVPHMSAHDILAREVDAHLASGAPLENQLYRWHARRGWVRRP